MNRFPLARALCLLAVLALAACNAAQGGERQACYPNGTCNAGLTCASSVCVALGDTGPSDAALALDSGATDSASSPDASTCGDGVAQPGECDPASASHCPSDCALDAGADAWVDPCAGHVYYAGMASNATSVWATLPHASGLTGLDAGNAECEALGVGADHVCDYDELRRAELAGELSAIPMGTTVWLQRTTTVDVAGSPSAPGQGGRCVDWTFSGNHLADGEYITFDALGVPTYHFDADTYFDGVDTTHVTVGDLECGGVMRSLPCCYPSCL